MTPWRLSKLEPAAAMDGWKVFGPLLERACEGPYGLSRYCIEDVQKQVADGWMMLMAIWNPQTREVGGVLACERSHTPGRTIFVVSLAGGFDAKHWLELYPALRAMAIEDFRCDQIEIVGRPGWARLFAEAGLPLKPRAVVYIDDIAEDTRPLATLPSMPEVVTEISHG